jgi:uncharacterized protein YjiS (DUF1127 family)
MMHAYSTTIEARTPATLGARLARVARRAWHAYWDWRARQATVQILRALDNRTLRDIGLSRSEIESAVHGKRGERRVCYDEDWQWRTGA